MASTVFNNDDLIKFLKKYSAVDDDFVDDFFSLYNASSRPSDFIVDLEIVAKWLQTKKGSLKKTLVTSYLLGIDYSVERSKSKLGRGKGNNIHTMLTADCFKAMCMMSRTAKAREVRAYFIAVERTLFKYRDEIVHGMDNRIKVLERNQKQKLEAKDFIGGVIYVIKASLDMDSVYKIGRTKDLSKRLASHSSASADSLEIVYKFKTSCVNKVESCLKLMIKEKQYRKYKEVYQIDIASLKKVISSCDDACIEVVQTPKANKKHQIGGGQYYAVLISN